MHLQNAEELSLADTTSTDNNTTGSGSVAEVARIGEPKRVMRVQLDSAERYRLAVVLASHDCGTRALCAAGRGCGDNPVCGFCPRGVLRPQPLDAYETYLPAIAQARSLWGVGLCDVPNHVLSVKDVPARASLGAMLLAAHVGGHNCISAAFDGVLPLSVPHEVVSLTGLQSWVRRAKIKLSGESADRLLAVCRLSVTWPVEGGVAKQETTHCFQVPAGFWKPFPEVDLPSFTTSRGSVTHTHKISLQVLSFSAALKSKDNFVVDRGYVPPVQRECVSCSSLPTGSAYCEVCHYVVTEEGHEGRCAQPTSDAVEVVMCRAQLGDVLHRRDVLLMLMHQDVPSNRRTVVLNKYVSGDAQAAFMRMCGYSGTSSILSTWFEAGYDYFRPYYVRMTFGSHPRWGSEVLSTLMPKLDTSNYSGVVAPDYKAVWDHLRTVATSSDCIDDPVCIANEQYVRGQLEGHAWYMREFTAD